MGNVDANHSIHFATDNQSLHRRIVNRFLRDVDDDPSGTRVDDLGTAKRHLFGPIAMNVATNYELGMFAYHHFTNG